MQADEFEIDLRVYIRKVFKYIGYILVATVVVAGIFFFTYKPKPPIYDATALVAIPQPQYQINLDPKIQPIDTTTQNSAAFLSLAQSDQVLVRLFDGWKDRPAEINKPEDLRPLMSVTGDTKTNLIKLVVSYSSATAATQMVNSWAQLLVDQSNDLLGSDNEAQMTLIQGQVDASRQSLEAAEKAYADYQGTNRAALLSVQLESLLQTQSDYLARQRNIEYLRQDIAALKTHIETDSNTNPSDQYNLLLFDLRAFNSTPSTVLTPPSSDQTTASAEDSILPKGVNLPPVSTGSTVLPSQLPVSSFTNLAKDQQLAYLGGLDQVLSKQSKDIDDRLGELGPQIQKFQQDVQVEISIGNRIKLNRDVAQETYTSLARSLDQARIQVNKGAKVISLASLPTEQTVKSSRIQNTVIAGVVVFVLGVIIVLLIDWWKSG